MKCNDVMLLFTNSTQCCHYCSICFDVVSQNAESKDCNDKDVKDV